MMHIGIIGAGIMGRTLAWHLSKQHFKISLFDKGNIQRPDNCSYVAAGMLSPFAEMTSSYPSLVPYGLHAIDFWRRAITSFSSKVFFSSQGTVCIAHAEHQNDLIHFKRTLLQKSAKDYFQLSQAQEIEPDIDEQFRDAIFLSEEAQVSAQMLLHTLVKEMNPEEVAVYSNSPVSKIAAQMIFTQKSHFNCDFVVDCRGLGAEKDLNTLRGVRGELIWVVAPTVTLKHVIRIFHPRHPLYILPRPQQQFILGASCIDTNDMSKISVRTAIELLSTAYSVNKGFAEARIIATKVHCRPAFEDNLPRIYLNPDEHIIRINGLYRHGYLFAPIFAEAIEHFLKTGVWDDRVLPFIHYEK